MARFFGNIGMSPIAAGLAGAIVLGAVPAVAQSAVGSGGDASVPMGRLIEQGFEIKASSPNGKKFVVFLQKDTTAYACEFVTLSNSRCGKIK